jgi:hypothetical protein
MSWIWTMLSPWTSYTPCLKNLCPDLHAALTVTLRSLLAPHFDLCSDLGHIILHSLVTTWLACHPQNCIMFSRPIFVTTWPACCPHNHTMFSHLILIPVLTVDIPYYVAFTWYFNLCYFMWFRCTVSAGRVTEPPPGLIWYSKNHGRFLACVPKKIQNWCTLGGLQEHLLVWYGNLKIVTSWYSNLESRQRCLACVPKNIQNKTQALMATYITYGNGPWQAPVAEL